MLPTKQYLHLFLYYLLVDLLVDCIQVTMPKIIIYAYAFPVTTWLLILVNKILLVKIHMIMFSFCTFVTDIAKVSVEQCEERYNELKKTHETRRYRDPLFQPEFITADCSKVSLDDPQEGIVNDV